MMPQYQNLLALKQVHNHNWLVIVVFIVAVQIPGVV
jgi:hypothetical protein